MHLGTSIHAALTWWAITVGTAATALEKTGTLEGEVVNRTQGEAPVSNAEVVLRIHLDGRTAVVASTTTDRYGTFRFADLPLGTEWVYLPGANHGMVHHPGPRVDLTDKRPRARVVIPVYDEVSHASPLVIAEHAVVIRPEDGVLQVRESLVVANPTLTCYVGRNSREEAEPVTFGLTVPEGVERVTFDKEFFGRRFSLAGDQLVTSLPWPPGRREIAFHYAVPPKGRRAEWGRRMDLPCAKLRVTVQTGDTDGVESNLLQIEQDAAQVVYESELAVPPGGRVYVAVRAASVPLSVYGRWISLVALLSLIAGAGGLLVLRKNRSSRAR